MPPELTKERRKWLAGLKAGDVIAVHSDGALTTVYAIARIESGYHHGPYLILCRLEGSPAWWVNVETGLTDYNDWIEPPTPAELAAYETAQDCEKLRREIPDDLSECHRNSIRCILTWWKADRNKHQTPTK